MPLNPAELFVARHCEGSFLSLWGMANPNGKHAGKELCDYIVVCDPDVIIVSVKEVGLASEPTKIEAERWRRKAIEESVKQVYGAERLIAGRKAISSPSGRSVKLPARDTRCIHRVCVAFGSCGKAGCSRAISARASCMYSMRQAFPSSSGSSTPLPILQSTSKPSGCSSSPAAGLSFQAKSTCWHSICTTTAHFPMATRS
jgi:hypothetical protein